MTETNINIRISKKEKQELFDKVKEYNKKHNTDLSMSAWVRLILRRQ